MAQGIIKIDLFMLLNMFKNDRHFETIKGVPRDAVPVSATYDVNKKVLSVVVESVVIPKQTKIPIIDIELYGNADAVDENGDLKTLKPSSLIG